MTERRSGATDHDKKKKKKQEKPQGHYPAVPPSPRGVKDIMVTQDTRSSLCSKRRDDSLCSKRRDEYVWPSKNRRSGASDHQKNGKQEKPQGALTPPLFSLPLGSKIYYGQVKVGDLSYLLRAYDDNTRKAPGGINPAVILSALGVQNILRPGKSC